MNKLTGETLNITKINIEKIKQLFPNACIDGKIDFEMLKLLLGDEVDDSIDRYSFSWNGKRNTIKFSQTPSTSTLIPQKQKSLNWDSTENLYIEGDNVEVLKLFQKTYFNRIKMIYIDPPYNTGHDFVYKDNFTNSIENYKNITSQENRANGDKSGRYHTDWLNMMYSRLILSRNLLTSDGVLFISIDDNEIANLYKISQEIFGEDNVEILIWNKEAEGSSGTLKATLTTRRIHEYVVCCFKNKDYAQFFKVREALKGRENELQTANLAVNLENEKTDHPNYFTITNPSGETFTRQWKWNKDEIERLIKEDLIYWGSDGHKQPRLIIPTDDRRKTFLLSILNYGGTTVGRKDFENLLGTEVEFSYPKPVILLKKLIETATEKNDIIMDFFSGSATTAQAVMQMNSEDAGSRKFILVQLPELCEKESKNYSLGYNNLCDIGEARIRKASQSIYVEMKSKYDNSGLLKDDSLNPDNLDFGFKVFSLESTNIIPWDGSYQFNETNIFNLDITIKEGRRDIDVAYEVMLKYGIFNMPLKEVAINNKKMYSIGDGYMIICLDNDITMDDVTAIAKQKPKCVVFKEFGLADDNVKINATYTLERLGVEDIKCI